MDDQLDDHMEQHKQAIQRMLEKEAEDVRVQRWHETYNAALGRAHGGYTVAEAHALATDHADILHGPK